jgi:predicted dehydrogenase
MEGAGSLRMTDRLRAAVIGVGYLGRFHALKYASLPDVELVAVVDIDADRARVVGAELGVPWVTAHADLLGAVDLVSVVTPTAAHFGIARDFLAAGADVLVEKPITSTAEEADELVRSAKEHGRLLQPGHIERFNPAWQAVAQRIHRPQLIRAHRLAPYGPRGTDLSVVLDLMIHDLDLILSIVDSPPVHVQASGMHLMTRTSDVCRARIDFANGCVAEVVASRVNARPSRKMRIRQPGEYLSIDFRNQRIQARLRSPSPSTRELVSLAEREAPPGDALLAEIRAFVHSARTRTPPVVSGEDGLSALILALEIDRLTEASMLGATG